jgi:hypothetical protein
MWSPTVGGALVEIGSHIIALGSDDYRVAINGDTYAKEVAAGAIRRCQLGLLCPCATAANVNKGRSLIYIRADIVTKRTYHGSVAADGDTYAMIVLGGPVQGVENGRFSCFRCESVSGVRVPGAEHANAVDVVSHPVSAAADRNQEQGKNGQQCNEASGSFLL